MVDVLAIQTAGLGHGTYCRTLRECFVRQREIQYDAFWSAEERSLPTRLITRLASLRVPIERVKSRNLDLGRARIEWAYGRMSRILAERKMQLKQYDALHFHTQVQALGSTALMRRKPSVVSLDMTAVQVAAERTMRDPWTIRPNIAMEKKIFAEAAHIVAWSEWAAQSVVDDYGIEQGRVSVIAPGVRMWELQVPPIVARERPKILFMGYDFVRKGGPELLEVFLQNFSAFAELHLVLNDPPTSLGPNVFVHRGVKAYSPEWQQLFAQSDIFVLASHAEAFGLVLQEAAAFGCTLIGSRVGGISSMVVDGENGFLVDPGDRVQLRDRLGMLLRDDALRLRMRHASRVRALEFFDADKNSRRMAAIFKAVA